MILGIHQSLVALYGNQQDQVSWLRPPHHAAVSNGRAPIDLVVRGTQDGLLSVRRFLDAARGGHNMQPNEMDEASRQHQDPEVMCLYKPIPS
ncbi:MbcA/ParS/Xre antitoxin family protein [Oryzibacter oryziterrae]|uniref:MbcA/ParS/Xre antitoxin family protein n=1 Tax=Oryzibacter oryziterrae TaxID=2766474 RepID=UPI0036F31254